MAKATFAGGCFWCVQPVFEKLEGVEKVVAGYTGGTGDKPTYEDYADKGHIEAVEVTFDPSKVSFERLLDIFWRQIDPTDAGGQFVDRGPQYRSAIFYHDEEQRRLAEGSKRNLEASGRFNKRIATEILQAGPFFAAEEYHQDYYCKSPLGYGRYRSGSGRDEFIEKAWGADEKGATARATAHSKPGKQELKKKLTSVQYKVTQEKGTEPPFNNEYWDNKREGIYVDAVSGEPLFSSLDKYDSGTGWPSFTKPLEPGNVVEKADTDLLMTRIEVRSKRGDSHLGHVFNDGPAPTGQRYCMNSAALRFIAKEDMESEGYGKYLSLFRKAGVEKKS